MNIAELYSKCMGTGFSPYPYQTRLADSAELPHMLNVPTGVGKTAAAVLTWIYRRRFAADDVRKSTPRRLVYCLPMRTLVGQTQQSAKAWLAKLNQEDVKVHVLMGGEEQTDWDIHPERDAILIGTQDMLLSRALNRGYGMSRYRWPMHFALLNNDALWVFDEVQLMDAGVATTAQLDAFRRKFQTCMPRHSLWMSATLDPEWLDTVDFDLGWLGEPHDLQDDDRKFERVKLRLNAPKRLQVADVQMGDPAAAAAQRILDEHVEGTRTLAVFNTVKRAVEVYQELRDRSPAAKTVLIHSRFRPGDRARKMEQLLEEPSGAGTIAITTQVVEAGVDVSAKTLFTELAPWSSLVQRFGRCNRAGEFLSDDPGRVFWFDLPKVNAEREKLAKPYTLDELLAARKQLQSCNDVGPASLENINVPMRLDAPHVIRRRDLIDLFDTTPDLAGNDIDISRFIRSGEEFDVQVFWRELKGKKPDPQSDGHAPARAELCRVPVGDFRVFVKKANVQGKVWRWDALERRWRGVSQQDVYPGQTFLVSTATGGYDVEIGWNPGSKSVEGIANATGSPEALDDDPVSELPIWQSIAEHTDDVVREIDAVLPVLLIDNELKTILKTAARWHDWGKAHPVFQEAVFDGRTRTNGELDPERPAEWRGRSDIGKAPGRRCEVNFWGRYARPHFRHELASALAMLAREMDDLAVYVVAAHHGKVRLSIRSLPGELTPDDDPSRLFARGVWHGDLLPETKLGDGVTEPEITLSLECMQLGRSANGDPSWTERMLKLREHYGPFRLAFFEALLRAADMRASEKAANQLESDP